MSFFSKCGIEASNDAMNNNTIEIISILILNYSFFFCYFNELK